MNDYQILGVTSSTPKEEVKRKYRELSRIYHPDNVKTGNEKKFKMVKDAYENIMSGRASDISYATSSIRRHLRHKSIFTFEAV